MQRPAMLRREIPELLAKDLSENESHSKRSQERSNPISKQLDSSGKGSEEKPRRATDGFQFCQTVAAEILGCRQLFFFFMLQKPP